MAKRPEHEPDGGEPVSTGPPGQYVATGAPRHDLICKPWCLFNLTADIGERDDLGQNPAYQAIAQKIAARLKWHGSTGPLPAYIWPDLEVWATKVDEMCNASVKSGYLEPLDANSLDDGSEGAGV